MNNVFDYLADYLDVALTDTTTRYGLFTDDVDNMVVLRAGGGMMPKNGLGNRSSWLRRPYLQVRVRNKSYTEGYSQAEEVIRHLEIVHGTVNNQFEIIAITANGDILDQGRDDKNRYKFLVSFTIHITTEEN